jgi:hypothetical protein
MILLETLVLDYIHKNHKTLRYNKKFLNTLIKNVNNNNYHIVYYIKKNK